MPENAPQIPRNWRNPETGETATVGWFPPSFAETDGCECCVSFRRPPTNRFEELEAARTDDGLLPNGGFNDMADWAVKALRNKGFEPVEDVR